VLDLIGVRYLSLNFWYFTHFLTIFFEFSNGNMANHSMYYYKKVGNDLFLQEKYSSAQMHNEDTAHLIAQKCKSIVATTMMK
jgi:hypothetical protein